MGHSIDSLPYLSRGLSRGRHIVRVAATAHRDQHVARPDRPGVVDQPVAILVRFMAGPERFQQRFPRWAGDIGMVPGDALGIFDQCCHSQSVIHHRGVLAADQSVPQLPRSEAGSEQGSGLLLVGCAHRLCTELQHDPPRASARISPEQPARCCTRRIGGGGATSQPAVLGGFLATPPRTRICPVSAGLLQRHPATSVRPGSARSSPVNRSRMALSVRGTAGLVASM